MTGILIVLTTIVLLVLALEPAHRRARRGTPPAGSRDRDEQRMLAELRGRAPARDVTARRRLPTLHLRRHPVTSRPTL